MKFGCILACGVAVISAPAFGASQQCGIAPIAELPVTMIGMRPTVPVKIDGKPASLMADSGAFATIITPATAAELNLNMKIPQRGFDEGMTLEGVGGTAEARIAIAKTFELGKAMARNVQLIVGGSGIGSGGVLGRPVLMFADTEFDLANGIIRIVKPMNCGGRSLAYWAGDKPFSALPISNDVAQRGVRSEVMVNGVTLQAMFDSGSSSTILSLAAAARAGVKPGDPGVVEDSGTHGIGRHVGRSWVGQFDSIKIGGEEVRHARLRFGQLSGIGIDILIGADFFLSHHIYVAASQDKMYFTYNGGPIFSVEGKGASGEPPLSDPDALARRAAAKVAAHDLKGALTDYDKAVAVAPNVAMLVARADVLARLGDMARAQADLDQAVTLAPDDFAPRLRRARLLIHLGQRAPALADLERAAALMTPSSDARLELADLYISIDAFGPAIAQINQWMVRRSADSRTSTALNLRCWARGLANEALEKALADCNAALRARPDMGMILDSRGLVKLRMGDARGAIADYDQVLAQGEKHVWSYLGRGVAKMRMGDKPGGGADIEAALALDPKILERARALHIVMDSDGIDQAQRK